MQVLNGDENGGIEMGFTQTGKCHIAYANEFDKYAQVTYRLNHPDVNLDCRDIHEVNPSEVGSNIDIIVGGFPCQAFSIAGYRKGFEDERGDLFFELLRMIAYHKPKAILIENVKNLVGHDKGNTFNVIRESLISLGYYIKWKVLNGKDSGNIPQNRERIYVVGFNSKEAFDTFSFPEDIPLTTKLADIIDFDIKVDDKYYYTKEKYQIYDRLVDDITSQDTVYQWRRQYVRENKAGVVPTLTANMGTGGHNVPLILSDDGIRKLTPREAFNAQGYPKDFKLPELTDSHLYKQAGNSVVIPVVKRIADNMINALEKSSLHELEIPSESYIIEHTIAENKFEGESYAVGSYSHLELAQQVLEHTIPNIGIKGSTPILKKISTKEYYKILEV